MRRSATVGKVVSASLLQRGDLGSKLAESGSRLAEGRQLIAVLQGGDASTVAYPSMWMDTMSPSPVLAALASHIDEFFHTAANLVRARELAEACLVDREQSHIRFPELPDEPFPDDDIPLMPGQRVLAMAALHDLVCTGVEKVIPIDPNLPLFDSDGSERSDSRRDLRWVIILDLLNRRLEVAQQVPGFQATLEHWFTLQFRHLERDLADLTDDARHGGTDIAPTPAHANSPPQPDRKARKKRSTTNGDAHVKLIAALTNHHAYDNGSCTNLEPIGNNELARQADVSNSVASEFFQKKFKGHGKYKALCRDLAGLAAAIKLLNNEFAPHALYDRSLGENERVDE
jgi:hypothetical protein